MCGVVRFVQFSYYKTANRTAPCDVVQCGALLLVVQCGFCGLVNTSSCIYTILLFTVGKKF